MIGLDCFCLVVSPGLAHVFVMFVRKQKVQTITAGHIPLDCLHCICISLYTHIQYTDKHTKQKKIELHAKTGSINYATIKRRIALDMDIPLFGDNQP